MNTLQTYGLPARPAPALASGEELLRRHLDRSEPMNRNAFRIFRPFLSARDFVGTWFVFDEQDPHEQCPDFKRIIKTTL